MDKRIKQHIEITSGTCGGKPRIAGHHIWVQDIVIDYEHWGMSPEDIVESLPTITLADVYAALVYYYDNPSCHLDKKGVRPDKSGFTSAHPKGAETEFFTMNKHQLCENAADLLSVWETAAKNSVSLR